MRLGQLFGIIGILIISITKFALANTQYLSPTELIVVAEKFAAQGQLDKAGAIYLTLNDCWDASIRTESLFQLGNIAMAQGDYKKAIDFYRKIVDGNPNLSRVRLELALAYFMNKEYHASQFHFEFVRATPNLPDTVRQKIDMYLSLIRMRKNWSVDFVMGIIPDSNINNSGNSKQECINTIFGPLCRPIESKKSGVGISLSADTNYYLRFSERFGLRNTFGVNILDFPTSDFDDVSVYFASGPRYVFDSGEISLQPMILAHWYAGDLYNLSYGLQLDTNWQMGQRWLFSVGGQIKKNKYHVDYIDRALGGYNLGLWIQPRFYVNNKSFLLAGIQFNQTDTNIKSYGNNNFTYSVGYFGEFRYGFTLLVRLDFINTRYRDSVWAVVDNQYLEQVRGDNMWQFYTRISNNKINWYNIIPAISYSYTSRDSNIPLYDFDKHRIKFEIMRRF